MASPFQIVDEEYIKELKDMSENENKKNSTEWKKLASKFKWVREQRPQPTIVAVLSIQKFRNFALHVINK